MEHWENFCGARFPNTNSTIDYTIPTVASDDTSDFGEGTIYDYFGIATKKSGRKKLTLSLYVVITKFGMIGFAMKIYKNAVNTAITDTDNVPSDFALLRRGKRYDYFTSSLPSPQKGSAVELPLGTSAPVISTGVAPTFQNITDPFTDARNMQANAATNVMALEGAAIGTSQQDLIFVATGLETDLSAATSATINALRLAITTQQFQEREMRGGTRYVELLKSHFQVVSPDFRLQRSELLATYSTSMNVNVVPQNSGTGQTGQTTHKVTWPRLLR